MIGKKITEKLNMAKGPTVMMLPLKGVSMIDAPDQVFYGKDEDEALFNEFRTGLNKDTVELIELPLHINDQAFAEAAAQKLIDLLSTNS